MIMKYLLSHNSPACLLSIALCGAAVLSGSGAEYHVSLKGDDANDGSKRSMLRTISAAAQRAQPGDVVTVHQGTYRERIDPPRGGTASKPIVYRAARGEKVEILGSELVTNWTRVQEGVWKATLPNSLFGSFNPYTNVIAGDWFNPRGRRHHTGAVYLNGEWLVEATKLDEVTSPEAAPPMWFNRGPSEYLMNVAWLRVSRDGAARIPAAGSQDRQGVQKAPSSEACH